MKRIYLLIISILLIPTISFACGIEKEYIYPEYDTTQEVLYQDKENDLDYKVKFTKPNQEITYEILLKNTCDEELTITNISLNEPVHKIFKYSYNNIKVGDKLKSEEERIILINIITDDIASDYGLSQDVILDISYGRNVADIENPKTGAFISISFVLILIIMFVIIIKLKKRFKKIETLVFIIAIFVISSITTIAKYETIGNLIIKGHITYDIANKDSYLVKIDPNEGKFNNVNKIFNLRVEEDTKIDLTDIKREDYEFIDWTLNEKEKYNDSTITISKNTNLSANWKQLKYNLYINPNGGLYDKSTDITTVIIKIGEKYELFNPTRQNYKFLKWEETSKTNFLVDNFITMGESNSEVTAKWCLDDGKSYTINFEPKGGVLTINSINRKNGTNYDLLIPSREGYNFLGWYDINDNEVKSSDCVSLTDDLTLYAKWEGIKYDVEFDPNGGTKPSKIVVTMGENYGELPSTTKVGYTFNGWYLDKELTNQITSTTAVNTPSNHTLYAGWLPNGDTPYKVKHYIQKIDGNASLHNLDNYTLKETSNLTGVTDSKVTPQIKAYEGFTAPSLQEITILSDGSAVLDYYYTRNSYTLNIIKGTGVETITGAGTYLYENNVNITYTIKQGYTFTGITGDIMVPSFKMPAHNVTAQINALPNTYTVTLNPNGGTCTSTSKTVTYDGTYGALADCTKTGYIFNGWYDNNNNQIIATTPVKILSNQTLTAKYTPINLTVNFDYNSGTCDYSSKTVTYDSAYGTLPNCSKTGYTFTGWYTTKTGSESINSSTIVKNANNHTLYAQWIANTYIITFNANGGSVSPTSKQVTYDSTYGNLPTPTRTNYVFDGWFTAETGGTKIESQTTMNNASNHPLYAHWTLYYPAAISYYCPSGGTLNADHTCTVISSYSLINDAYWSFLHRPAEEHGYSDWTRDLVNHSIGVNPYENNFSFSYRDPVNEATKVAYAMVFSEEYLSKYTQSGRTYSIDPERINYPTGNIYIQNNPSQLIVDCYYFFLGRAPNEWEINEWLTTNGGSDATIKGSITINNTYSTSAGMAYILNKISASEEARIHLSSAYQYDTGTGRFAYTRDTVESATRVYNASFQYICPYGGTLSGTWCQQ